MDEIKSTYKHFQSGPFSLIGCSLVRKNVLSRVLFWMTSISLIFNVSYRTYFIIIPSINMHEATTVKYEQILDQTYSLCLGLIIIYYEFARSLYMKYLDCYQTLVTNNFGNASPEFVCKWVKIIRLWVILASIYETTTLSINNYLYFQKFNLSTNMFVTIFIELIAQLSYILSIQFIIECCVYSQSTFIPINTLLDTLLDQNKHPSTIEVNKMVKLTRVYYIKTIKSIRYMDKFLSYAIFIFYSYFIGHCIFIFSSTLHNTSSLIMMFYSVFRFLGEASYLVFITYHLIQVYQLSVKIFDKVYQLSLTLNSDHSIEPINEINLFLLRINRNDVGFTFAGLYLVSPSFVSSLATISLTLGLALPSLIKK